MKQHKKIDIYLYNKTWRIWQYECSTLWSRTCKEAKLAFCKKHGLDLGQVKVCYSKG